MLDKQTIQQSIPHCIRGTHFDFANPYVGKVRDTYDLGEHLLIVTTDRQSAFDRLLGHIPFKGQVLNQTSLFWFENTQHIIKNHMIDSPHPNAIVTQKCTVLPIEFVVRGYMTGSTDTSLWTHYHNGARDYCGHTFPDGMKKNQQLPTNVVTPTTKETDHDRPITPTEIVAENWLTQEQWDYASQKALELFAYGQQVAAKNGLILVDTKYEFGINSNGDIILIDEIHTPDSSRYWLADSYAERFANGDEPHMIDKEFFRLWFREQCDPYGDDVLPNAPTELVVELSARYIELFERITGQKFVSDGNYSTVLDTMRDSIQNYLNHS